MSSPLISMVRDVKEMLFRDDIVSAKRESTERLERELIALDADVVAPLIAERDVIGLIVIGQKRSGDPYYSDDADLLATLANQSSVAIRNAQAHERVVQLNKKLETILSTIESGVVAVGAKGKITLFNCAAERLTGMSADGIRGRPLEELPAPLAGWIASTIADGQPCSQVEFALPDPAGQLVPLVCSTSPLVNPAGPLLGAVAVINDISHLKALEHERRRAERLASIEAIASGLVHEIRNPLVAIKTFFQLLPTRYQDPEFRETFARTADRELRRIDTLLTRFRTLASASSQPMATVDITDPIRHTLDLLRPQIEEQQIRVRHLADGAPRRILGNVSQLEQLFLNLCLNAIEAMGNGGELTVRVADLSEGGGTTLIVEVSDTGSGIPSDLLTKLFNPFITTKARGSGLGLAICRSIVDAHRARLSARNNLERAGSTFTIEFPVPVPEPSPTATTA
jgi:PAS domain S-box-containing protein